MNSVLEIQNVFQSFRAGFWMKPTSILQDVSFEVPRGAIFGFLGPNGAGKTTLIHLIAGLRRPKSGRIQVLGHDAQSVESRALIGYLPERPYFYEHLTGVEFLTYFGTLSRMDPALLPERIETVLATVGMTHAGNRELRAYSKGMLQRIGIAQAILHDPELLIFDEPMSGLDPVGRKEIRELILSLAQAGKTIFFSTHIIPDVEAICDQVAVIEKGRIRGCGKIGSFLSQGPLQTEVAFQGVAIEALKKLPGLIQIREMPDGIRALVDGQESAEALVRKILDSKGSLLWVTPVRPSLESIFTQERSSRGEPL